MMLYHAHNWFAEAVITLTRQHRDELTDDKSRAVIDVHSESFIIQVQNIVGGAISTLSRNKKLCSPDTKEESLRLIDKMRFGMYSDKIDEEYKRKYFPQLLQHCNNGGLSLIQASFIPFAQSLMKTCVEAARKRHGYKMQSTWISKGLITVETSEELLSQFQKVVLTEMGDSFNLDLTKMIYKRIALYSFRAYAKFTDKQDHCSTSSAKSLSNIELRKLIACGASEDKNTKKKKAYNEKIRNWRTMVGELEPTKAESSPTPKGVSSELAQSSPTEPGRSAAPGSAELEAPTVSDQPATKRQCRKTRTKKDIQAEYRAMHDAVLSQLQQTNGDVSELKRKQHCSILFVSFGKYFGVSTPRADVVKEELEKCIAKEPNWMNRVVLAPPAPSAPNTTTTEAS